MSGSRPFASRLVVLAAAVALAAVGGVGMAGGDAPTGGATADTGAAAQLAVPATTGSQPAPPRPGAGDPPPPPPARVAAAAALPQKPRPNLLVRIDRRTPIYQAPGVQRVVGEMPPASPYLGTPVTAYVAKVSDDGRWGQVPVPWTGNRRSGWIRLDKLARSSTPYTVRASVSKRQIEVRRLGKLVLRVRAGIGRVGSATPPGTYFVTDRVPVPPSQSWYGTYAFGLSGTQTSLPKGWKGGGDQLAIHGTNDPSSIGTRSSAGCFRVSERALQQLKPLLKLGTPVIIEP